MKYIITIIVALILISGFLFWQGVYVAKDPDSNQIETFLIKKGQSAEDIAKALKWTGIIKYSFAFKNYVSLTKQSNNLKAGEYELSPSMTVAEIVRKMTSGEMKKNMFTIIEGWTIEDIGKYLEKENLATLEQLLYLDNREKEESYFKKDFEIMSDKPEGSGLEGYLFPDTYEFRYDDNLEDVVRRMIANLEKKTKEINLSESYFETIIKASLIEKEVRTPEDMKMVSGVLDNRIEAEMPLQIDASINYITGRKTTEILKEELKIDSPYNTYLYKGMPIGPIASPGIEAIKAAIDPTENDYLFYLSTREGKTIFSKTFKEHQKAIEEHLRN